MAAPAGPGAVVAAPERRRWLWPVLAAALGLLTTGISALEVYTPKEIFVANGTQGTLTCKFKSPNTTGMLTSVSWSFQPEGTDTMVSLPSLPPLSLSPCRPRFPRRRIHLERVLFHSGAPN